MVMTVGILGGILCCIFFLKGYMKRLKAKPKKEASGKPGFGAHATTALFVGLCATFVGSYVGRAVHADWLPLAVAVIAGAVMGLFEYLIHKKGMRWLENFSLAASMLAAMAGAAAAGVFVIVYISFMGYAGDRVTAWLHPEQDPGDTGYQILQSLYAIGSGGLFGLGFGKSRQKYLYLPFQYNDYIFAVCCEELGLCGAAAICVLFAAMILRGYWISLQARDRFSTVLASGLVTLIAVQTVLNLCVVTNLLPSTGIALPFFSYGGTALAVNLGEMGIVLQISRQRNQRKIQEEIL